MTEEQTKEATEEQTEAQKGAIPEENLHNATVGVAWDEATRAHAALHKTQRLLDQAGDRLFQLNKRETLTVNERIVLDALRLVYGALELPLFLLEGMIEAKDTL